MKLPKVSVIIPLYKKTPYFFESVGRCLEMDYPNFEILIGVDGKTKVSFKEKKIKVLHTGMKNTGPAEKRDVGIRHAKGDIIAFLDDDSYPEADWLKKSISILNKKKVEVVCGPGLTPHWDSFSQKVTGGVLSSLLGSGPFYYRFTQGKPRFVEDYPAYNMILRKSTLEEVGGFGTKFYGGEDTAICLKIVNSGKKIYYHPDIIVYHHRRRFPFEYIKQVGNVGLHRGFFVKKYPQTSLKFSYFAPSVFTVLFPFLIIASLINSYVLLINMILFVLFYVVVLIESASKNSLSVNFFLPFAIIVNYMAYGTKFIKGLFFTKNLDR